MPRGKRVVGSDGAVNVAAKNSNGDGSVYYEAPCREPIAPPRQRSASGTPDQSFPIKRPLARSPTANICRTFRLQRRHSAAQVGSC
jgi:hypothetical protein